MCDEAGMVGAENVERLPPNLIAMLAPSVVRPELKAALGKEIAIKELTSSIEGPDSAYKPQIELDVHSQGSGSVVIDIVVGEPSNSLEASAQAPETSEVHTESHVLEDNPDQLSTPVERKDDEAKQNEVITVQKDNQLVPEDNKTAIASKENHPPEHLTNSEWLQLSNLLNQIDLSSGQSEDRRISLISQTRNMLGLEVRPADCKRAGMVGTSLREALLSRNNIASVWEALQNRFPTIQPTNLPPWFQAKLTPKNPQPSTPGKKKKR